MANYTTVDMDNCSNYVMEQFSVPEKQFILAVDVVFSSFIILTGVVGNMLSMMVLRQDVRKSSMSVLLLALAIYDFSFVVLSVPYLVFYHGLGTTFPAFRTFLITSRPAHVALPAMWYLGNVARTGRNWIIVMVAIDRFMVVQNPFLTSQRSNPYRAKLYSFVITVTAILFNMPVLFEYRLYEDPCDPEISSIQPLSPSDLNPIYALLYKKIMNITFIVMGPMLLLLIFNVLLIRSLLVAYNVRASITRETSRRYQETKMLVLIIAVFVICEIPGAIWHLMFNRMSGDQTWFYTYFFSSCNCLTLINSAINFFIYCVWGRNFRRNMMYILKRQQRPDSRIIRFDSEHSDPTRQVMLQHMGTGAATGGTLVENKVQANGNRNVQI